MNKFRVYVDNNPNSGRTVTLKGSSQIDTASFYCPYIPLATHGVLPMKSGWEGQLEKINGRFLYAEKYISSETLDDRQRRIMWAIGEMQAKYPGNYTLDEHIDSNSGYYKYQMVFDTPEEESLFLLKYSDK